MLSKTDNGAPTNYTYDYANRLISIRNSYDGYGRRVSRLVNGSGFGIPEAEKTDYFWDGTNVLLEFYQNKGNPLEYIYGNGQLVSRDDLLVLPVSKRLVYQNSYWFHQDGLGSVVNLTNSTGTVKLSYGYDAFGEITKEEGQVGWKKNRYTFTGKPYDQEVGMYYFGARWYEEEAGRFVTKDPCQANVFIPINLNKYTYCYNNPTTWIDPFGERALTAEEWRKIYAAYALLYQIGYPDAVMYYQEKNISEGGIDWIRKGGHVEFEIVPELPAGEAQAVPLKWWPSMIQIKESTFSGASISELAALIAHENYHLMHPFSTFVNESASYAIQYVIAKKLGLTNLAEIIKEKAMKRELRINPKEWEKDVKKFRKNINR